MKTGKQFFAIRSKFSHLFGDGELDGKKILTGLLQTVYKLDDAKIGEILKDGAKPEDVLTAIVEVDKARVKKLDTTTDTEKFQQGYKKAQKEALTAFETSIKEAYGITSEKIGQELIDEIVAAKSSEGGAKTEDEIKKTPTYQALENKYKADMKKAKDEFDGKIKTIEDTHKKEGVFQSVGKNALTLLDGLNPILPKSASVAETYKSGFLNELKGFEYELSGDKILVSKGGNLLKDEHGNTLEWEDHVKSIATKHFEFSANNGGANGDNRNNPNDNGNQGGAGEYPKGIKKPTNESELAKIMSDSKIETKDKRIVMDTFKKEYAKA